MSISRKCNNPLNIRFNSRNNWVGQVGDYKGFCVFRNEAYGFRAAYMLLCNYIRKGIRTIEDIIRRYAPPSENDTENYITFVSDDVMIPRDKKLTNQSIHDYWTIIMIIRAMAKMESGKWYDEQQINLFINYPQNY